MKFRGIAIIAATAMMLASCGGEENPTPSNGGGTTTVTFNVTPTTLTFDAGGGTSYITVTASAKPSATSNQSWITRTIGDLSNNKVTITVTAAANTSTSERTAELSLKQGDNTAKVTITQAGKSGSSTTGETTVTNDYDLDPDTSLSNANATAEAKSLYNKLLGYYGSKTISGAMGSWSWGTEYTDLIYESAGSNDYPGIVGFDYIHIDYAGESWAADYNDISTIKECYEAGNLIQIGWHWRVPSSQANVGTPKNYSYDTKAFKIADALTEGTWQNELIKEQIAQVAASLQLIQEAGIPVLFRPLHEAAGDYGYGAWFWWGYEGSEYTKKLWKYLRNTLENDYGINNLIWVWTAQTSDNGNMADVSDLEEWYPGDEYVDIVGADLYVDKNTTQSEKFYLVNNSVKGKKMVTLSEIGNLFDIDGYFEEDAPWLYFMNWCYQDGNTWSLTSDSWSNTGSDWKKAMANSHTLNRGDI